MSEYDKHVKELLVVLNEEGILDNMILIGSWCLLFYKHVFDNFEPTIRSTDIDFYITNPNRIKTKNGIINSLKSINYDVVYDVLTNKSTFISPDGFEIEFLTRLNRDQLACMKLGNTNTYAVSLPYLDIFTGNYIVVNYEGINVRVASPSSYVIQKLLINDVRENKKAKDIESVKHVLFYIGASMKYKDELIKLYNSLPTKWKNKIKDVAYRNDINIERYNNTFIV